MPVPRNRFMSPVLWVTFSASRKEKGNGIIVGFSVSLFALAEALSVDGILTSSSCHVIAIGVLSHSTAIFGEGTHLEGLVTNSNYFFCVSSSVFAFAPHTRGVFVCAQYTSA